MEEHKKNAYRRIIRAKRMLYEMGYGDIIDALEDLKKYRDKYGDIKTNSRKE
jgi:hypothetical protein